jgi:hypothetical protein
MSRKYALEGKIEIIKNEAGQRLYNKGFSESIPETFGALKNLKLCLKPFF